MESYVLHIYRRDNEDQQKVVGLIEIVNKGETRRFSSFDDLRDIIVHSSEIGQADAGT